MTVATASTIPVVHSPLSAEDFAAIQDPTHRHELIRGEVITMPPPHTDHGIYAGKISGLLFMKVFPKKLGTVLAAETGVLLESDPDTVRAADVSFISENRLPKGARIKGYFRGAPDFVVEVLSANDVMSEVDDKIDQWLANGARLVWMVNPRRKTVNVYRPGKPVELFVDSQTLDASDVVDDFTMPVAEIFVLD